MFRLLGIVASITPIVASAETAIAIAPPQEFVAPEPLIEVTKDELYCLAENVYFEARNKSFDGKVAVAHATINRVESKDFPNTICEVTRQGPLDGSPISKHRCQFSWFCDGKSDQIPVDDTYPEQRAWEMAQLAAEVVAEGWTVDETKGSTYYHADYVDPFWNEVYTMVTEIDSHLFYRHN